MTDDDVDNLLVHQRQPPPFGYVLKYPADKLRLDPPSPNSLQDMCFRIVSKLALSFVNRQRFTDWHFRDFCLEKKALVDIFGFPPVLAYFVLPPLDYRYYCSCWSYVNQTYDPSKEESDDDVDEASWDICVNGRSI